MIIVPKGEMGHPGKDYIGVGKLFYYLEEWRE